MMMWTSFACVVCLIGVAQLTILPGRTWRRKSSGFAADVGYTYKGQVRGVVDCSRVCSKLSSTKSYFYYADTRECQCHDCTYTGAETEVQDTPNVRYYEEVIEIHAVDLANMTTLPCPSDASVATDVIRDGNSLFRVRAFFDTDGGYDEAQAVCVANGGILYKATTLEKFELAHQLMTQCSAYMPYTNFYVNGKYNDVTARWETSDGEPISQFFWDPEQPNGSGIKCLWMSAVFPGYRWDDRNCGVHASYPTYAFCEIPQK